MFFTFLRRELAGRRRQTIIIAIGMALAIALVMLVNSVSVGVRDAQRSVLSSIYGVGTDLTISQTPTPPTGAPEGGRFNFGSREGEQADGSRTLAQSRLVAGRESEPFAANTVETVKGVSGVAGATGVLSLRNIAFSGQLPSGGAGVQGGTGGIGPGNDTVQGGTGTQGGAQGDSSFNVDSFTVLGVDPEASAVGPLSAIKVSTGRALNSSDTVTPGVLLDENYAKSANLATGGTINIGGTSFTIVGTVTSTGSDATTAANTYIPLALAQSLSSETDKISQVYVQAKSADLISQVQAQLATKLPNATVSSQSDLASQVSGSLGTASSLITNLGLWVSVAALAAAFLIAILLTIQGVSRRTREFGTLKAIGWTNSRVVGQVAGESLVQGLIGGATGLVLGLIGIWVVNLVAPTLGASTRTAGQGFRSLGQNFNQGGPGGFGGSGSGGANTASVSEIALQAPITLNIVVIAIAIAVLGGLFAGVFGGWRAARLRPAAALRSLA